MKQAEHAVYFYRGNDDLAETVAGYLAAGIGVEGVAVAITTAQHLLGIKRQLAAAGVDVQSASRRGRLVFLDAASTLANLIVDGQVDREAFDREIGGLIRSARERARDVRAYGEMVDLLWQAGDIPGAIELEQLWNELIAEQQFALLCAYQSADAAGPEHEHALHEICRLHSSVSSASGEDPRAANRPEQGRELSCEFQAENSAPGAARRFVEQALERWGYSRRVIEDARLLISELVANAVIHTRSPCSVSICAQPSGLRLTVADESPTLPSANMQSFDRPEGGRGLKIVAAFSQDWGVVSTPPGKAVWAEL